MTTDPTAASILGPITPFRCTEPGCHWACHGVPDKYSDSRARILAEHHAAEHAPQAVPAPAAIWSDGDPLMQAIAATVYEQCETYSVSSIVVDDPRNIAAVAATVARRILGTPTTHTETSADDDPRRVPADLGLPPAEEIALLRRTVEAVEEGRAELRAENARLRAELHRLAAEAQQPTPAPAEEQRQPTPAPCTNPCIACMTDESHDPAPAKETK